MENIKKRTLTIIRNELNESVDKFNECRDAAERIKLKVEHDKLKKEFELLSLHDAYTTFFKDAVPVLAMAKAFYYASVNVQYKPVDELVDGVLQSVEMGSIKDTEKRLDLMKFLAWTEERNKCVAHDKNWKSVLNKSRDAINAEWRKFMESEDGYKMNKTAIKKALQNAFDALAFIPCENNKDKNVLMATGKVADYVIAKAPQGRVNSKDKKPEFTLNFLNNKNWIEILVDVLHMTVENKDYTIIYGEPEEEAKAEAEATAKAGAEKSQSKPEAEPKADTKTKGKSSGKKSK
jgi:hypothetical protein